MPTILHFDDEQVAHDTYGDRLREAGYSVRTTLTPEEFRETLKELGNKCDWIILDIMTESDMDAGLKLAEELSQEQRARTCILTKRIKRPIIAHVKRLEIPDIRIFSKTETSAKEFASNMKREFLLL